MHLVTCFVGFIVILFPFEHKFAKQKLCGDIDLITANKSYYRIYDKRKILNPFAEFLEILQTKCIFRK